MEITIDELKKITPQNNFVLIRLDRSQDELIMKGGGKLYLDTSFEVEKHAPVTGNVQALPEKLFYNRKHPDSLLWDTDMELQLEDYVICYFMSSVNAFSKQYQRIVTCQGQEYMFVKYENIFVAKRPRHPWDKHDEAIFFGKDYKDVEGFRIIPINGYLICEELFDEKYIEMEEKARAVDMDLPPMIKDKFSGKYVRVCYVGKPNKEYKEKRFTDENCDVVPGDVVSVRKHSNIPLEYDLHASLDGRKKFIRIQRKFVTGIIVDEKWKATLQTEISPS